MAKISYWDTLILDDVSWFEAQAINEAHDLAEVNRSAIEDASVRIGKLEQVIARQRTELGQLRAAVDTLLHMFAERELIDREMFGYRLEAAIENARERAQQTADTVACTACGARVARASTTFTATGLLCAACLAAAG